MYKQSIKRSSKQIHSTSMTMPKASFTRDADQSTTRGSHLLLLDPIPSLHHAGRQIQEVIKQNEA